MFKKLFGRCDDEKIWGKKITEFLIYLSVVLIPIIFLPGVNSVFSFPKLYVFRIITAIIIFIWGVRFLINKNTLVKWRPVLCFFVAYGFVAVLNTVFSINVFTSLFGNYGHFTGLFTVINLIFWAYIVMAEMDTAEKIKKLLWVSVAACFIISVYGIFQHQNWFVNVFSWTQSPQDRVFATIGHSNHTAAYIGMNLMILLGLFINSSLRLKILLSFMGVLMFSVLIMTASRGGMIALTAGILCWFFYIFYNKEFILFIRKKGKIIAFVLAVLLLGVFAFRSQIGELEVVKRSAETFDFIQEGNVPDRASWWMSSLEMFKDRPVLGSGLSTFRDMYNQYRRADYRLPGDIQDNITPEAAHMEYLNMLATQGFLGLAVYLAMIVAVFVYAKKLMQKLKEAETRHIVFALLTGIIVYLVQVFFSFGVMPTLFMLYTFMGVLLACGFLCDKAVPCTPAVPGKWRLPVRLIGGIIAFFIFIAVFYFSTLQFTSESLYKNAEVFASKRLYKEAITTYEKALKIAPYNHIFIEGYANFLFNLGIAMPASAQPPYLADATKLYDRAFLINPNYPSVHANKSLAASRLADLGKDNPAKFEEYKNIALEEMKKAAELSRNNPVYHYKYGQMLLFFGEKEQAKEQFENVLKIRDPYKDTAQLINQTL